MYVPRILESLSEGPDWVTFSVDDTTVTKFIIPPTQIRVGKLGLYRTVNYWFFMRRNWTYIHVFLDALCFQSINNVTEVIHIAKSSQSLYTNKNKFI